jgi:hypothetical protein
MSSSSCVLDRVIMRHCSARSARASDRIMHDLGVILWPVLINSLPNRMRSDAFYSHALSSSSVVERQHSRTRLLHHVPGSVLSTTFFATAGLCIVAPITQDTTNCAAPIPNRRYNTLRPACTSCIKQRTSRSGPQQRRPHNQMRT